MLLLCSIAFTGLAQNPVNSHPTIQSFGLRFDAASPDTIPGNDSAVRVVYVIKLKDTVNTSKVYVRISTGSNTNGSLLMVSYLVNSAPVISQGQVIYRRDADTLYISTINTSQMADNNYEVYTEDTGGGFSPVLSWNH